jgi:hypothetical protein
MKGILRSEEDFVKCGEGGFRDVALRERFEELCGFGISGSDNSKVVVWIRGISSILILLLVRIRGRVLK